MVAEVTVVVIEVGIDLIDADEKSYCQHQILEVVGHSCSVLTL